MENISDKAKCTSKWLILSFDIFIPEGCPDRSKKKDQITKCQGQWGYVEGSDHIPQQKSTGLML